MAAEVANNQSVPAEENAATEKKVEEVEAAAKEPGVYTFLNSTLFKPCTFFYLLSHDKQQQKSKKKK